MFHEGFEQILSVRFFFVRLVEARGVVVHLRDPYQSTKAPGSIVVIEPHAQVAHIHGGRVALVGAHCKICPGVVPFGAHRLDAATQEGHTIRVGDVRRSGAAAAMATGRAAVHVVLHVPGPPWKAFSAVGGCEGIIVHLQKDVDPLFREGLDG